MKKPKVMDKLPLPEGRERLISKIEVMDRVGLSFPQIWQLISRGEFPPARAAGAKPMWLESEIEHYIRTLPVKKYKGKDAA